MPAGKSPRPATEQEVVDLLNSGVDLVVHVGHGSDTAWQGCLSTRDLAKIKNAGHLPVMISAGCSTARFATLPPYEPYVDVQGIQHKGTDAGEVFRGPPPPPAPYQTGRLSSIGLGRQLVRGGPDGAVAYYGCNTGGQGVRRHAPGRLRADMGREPSAAFGRLLDRRRALLLRQGKIGDAQAERRLVSAEHFLPRHEVYAFRRSLLAVAEVMPSFWTRLFKFNWVKAAQAQMIHGPVIANN